MEFRSVALIALWTLVGGPILGTPPGPASGNRPAMKKSISLTPKQPSSRPVRPSE